MLSTAAVVTLNNMNVSERARRIPLYIHNVDYRFFLAFFFRVIICIYFMSQALLFILLHRAVANKKKNGYCQRTKKNSLGQISWCNIFIEKLPCLLCSLLHCRIDKKKKNKKKHLLHKGHISK
jgi:hypothetical protein